MKRIINALITFILLPVITIVITSCSDRNPFDVDLSDVPVDSIKISRYEKALFETNPYDILNDLEPYLDEFSFFLGDGLFTDEGQQQLFDYVTDNFLQELYLDVIEKFPDLRFLENELTEAFRYYRYYYPEADNPRVYTYVSGIDYMMPVKFAENHLIIGLDMYLGKDYINYERAGIPVFKRLGFTPKHILRDVMSVMAEKNMADDTKVPVTFLDYMIHEGKILYFLDLMLPNEQDSIKIAYTENQIKWMEANARLVWTYFIDNDMIYSKDRHKIKQFISDAPFTVVFGPGSAPRPGMWIGWQIVREYMKKNPEVTIQELLEEKNPREILNRASFRP